MKTIALICLIMTGCLKKPEPTSAEGSDLHCTLTVNESVRLTICEDKYVRCYLPVNGGVYCFNLK